jgi:hypothetical protein
MIVAFAMTQRPLNDPRRYAHLQAQIYSTAEILEAIQARQSRRCPTQTTRTPSRSSRRSGTKTRRGGYVFSVRPVNAEDGPAFRMERAAIGEVNQCVMDALSPWAC